MSSFYKDFIGRFELWLVGYNTHLIKHSDHSPTGEGIKIGAAPLCSLRALHVHVDEDDLEEINTNFKTRGWILQ